MAKRRSFDDYYMEVRTRVRAIADRKALEMIGATLGQFQACYDEGLDVRRAAIRIANEMYAKWCDHLRRGK